VEWSYRLLGDDEQRLFRHLAVFVDGVDLDDAEQVARDLGPAGDPGSVLARLVDASVVEPEFTDRTRYRMLETLRAFGLDRLAAAGEEGDAQERLVRWAVGLTGWAGTTVITEREPEADAALRRELANLRAAWRLARDRGSLDDAAAVITPLIEAIAYRDLVEIRAWAEELADDPALATHPRAAAVLGAAASAAYHRGDYHRADRLARAGLDRAADRGASWHCVLPLASAALARGAYGEAVDVVVAAAEHEPRVRDNLWLAALGAVYAGDLDRARALHRRGAAGAASPSLRAWNAYTAGEIQSAAGDVDAAERDYERALDLAGAAGATFVVGVATVGLLTVRAAAGRIHDALRGYRQVVDYFARTGNWTHQWATLRNLADLLRRLGDDEPAALLDAAADAAPDAPARGAPDAPARGAPAGAGTRPAPPVPHRAAVLDVARAAVDRHLSRR
jgi:tetratricopeptide (TPR) repeat protein